MQCKGSRKKLIPTTEVKVYLMGYPGKRYLSAQLAKVPVQEKNLFLRPNCRAIKRTHGDQQYRFLLFEQGDEKYETILKCIEGILTH